MNNFRNNISKAIIVVRRYIRLIHAVTQVTGARSLGFTILISDNTTTDPPVRGFRLSSIIHTAILAL